MGARYKCPACRELLIFPRGGDSYCEECGWPNEDFNEKYWYPGPNDNICGTPLLEFFDGKKWVASGLGNGIFRADGNFRGLYRVSSASAPKKRNKERRASTNKRIKQGLKPHAKRTP